MKLTHSSLVKRRTDGRMGKWETAAEQCTQGYYIQTIDRDEIRDSLTNQRHLNNIKESKDASWFRITEAAGIEDDLSAQTAIYSTWLLL